MKKISEIRTSVTSTTPTGDRISTVKLGELFLRESVVVGSAAKVIAKAIYLADETRPINEPITKFVKNLVGGKEIGSALSNGYKPYTVLRHLYSSDEKADAKLTITEDIFDALGIETHIAAAGILNAVDGLDNEMDAKEKLVAILRSGKAATEMKKLLSALKKAVSQPESTVVEMETPEGAAQADSPESMKKELETLRAQLAASQKTVGQLAALAGCLMATAENGVLEDVDLKGIMGSLAITGPAPEIVPEWLSNLREVAAIRTPENPVTLDEAKPRGKKAAKAA